MNIVYSHGGFDLPSATELGITLVHPLAYVSDEPKRPLNKNSLVRESPSLANGSGDTSDIYPRILCYLKQNRRLILQRQRHQNTLNNYRKDAYILNGLAIQGHRKTIDVLQERSITHVIILSPPHHKRHPASTS